MVVQVQYLDETIIIENPQLKFKGDFISISDGKTTYTVKKDKVKDYDGSGISVPNRG